jgi:hypothetical protein
MASLLDRIQTSLAKEGLAPRSRQARAWLQAKIQNMNPSQQSLMRDKDRTTTTPFIGHMYFFSYDPKTKDKLAFYDTFPLVIPVEQYADGFLGLNLHYIHPRERMILLDKMDDIASDQSYSMNTRLRINYNYLRAATKAFEARPCIKKYLYKQIKSRFVEIFADEWDIACMLPMETFVGATTNKVYANSRTKF